MQPPKLNLDLSEAVDGNAFNLLGYFSRQAKRAGWTRKQIDHAITLATASDYAYLVDYLTSL